MKSILNADWLFRGCDPVVDWLELEGGPPAGGPTETNKSLPDRIFA